MEISTTEKKRNNGTKSLSETLKPFQNALSAVKKLESKDPKLYNKLLGQIADKYSELLQTEKFIMEMAVGVYDYQKSIVQRVDQEPVTLEELQSLQNELETICHIFEI
jgi:hypothetical protein